MGTLVPFFEHRRDAILPGPSPRAMMTHVMTPACTPEEEAEGPEHEEEEEERDQEAQEAKAKSEWTMEGHSIAIVWIRGRAQSHPRAPGW